jgi:hypothetical protein
MSPLLLQGISNRAVLPCMRNDFGSGRFPERRWPQRLPAHLRHRPPVAAAGSGLSGFRSPRFLRPDKQTAPSRKATRPLIFVVVDHKDLLILYGMVLQVAGWQVRLFTHRTAALIAFLQTWPRPDLLLTDFKGFPFSAECLMRYCRRAAPGLKILMASGCNESCLANCRVQPDRFLSLPVAMPQLVQEVKTLLGTPKPRKPYAALWN